MKRIVIIADDLTGACDSGVQLVQKGLKAVVCLNKEATTELDTDVIIFDTDSRAMTKEKSYQEVKQMAAKLSKERVGFVYKKVDSTLRGNIGSEIDALMDHLSYDMAIIAPALPSLNRITKNGIHYLNQLPVEETEIAKDPKTPVKDSNILRLLSSQSKREPVLFPKEWLKENPETISSNVKKLLEQNQTLLIFDAESDEDLEEIVTGFKSLSYKILWVGSAGLAEKLPMERQSNRKKAKSSVEIKEKCPVLIVSGSRSTITQQQISRLLALAEVEKVEINPKKLIDRESRDSEILRCQTALKRYLKEGKDALLHVSQKELISGSYRSEIPYLISEALGIITAAAAEEYKLKGMIVIGGDTAKSISTKLGVHGVEIIQEIERGLPLSKMIGGPELPIITKAGAFGAEGSLHRALKHLKGDSA